MFRMPTMHRRFLSPLLVVFLFSTLLYSFPHLGDRYDLVQPDGSKVPVLVWGDEFYQRVEDLNGYTLVRNEQDWICYATVNRDRSRFVPTAVIYTGRSDIATYSQLRALNVVPGLQLSPEEIGARRKAAVRTLFPNGQNYVPSDETRSLSTQNVVGVTFIVDFSDEPAVIPKDEFDDYLHKDGYDKYGNTASVKQYFYVTSGNKFTYTNLLVGYIRAPRAKSYYDENVQNTPKARELVNDVIRKAINDGVDFSSLTTGSSGNVLAVNIFYAGFPSHGWAKGLWPHSAGPGSINITAGNKRFNRYQMTNIGTELSIGTFCHENGHMVLNLPDLYDYKGKSGGVGRFCLMCNTDSKNPQPICLPLKAKYTNWVDLIDLTSAEKGKEYSIVSNSTNYYVYKKSGSGENFYLESATKNWFWGSYADWGLLVWHADWNAPDDPYTGSINDYPDMTADKHFAVSLEQADGQFHMEKGMGYGHYGDLFQSKNNSNFVDNTAPNSKWWTGSASGFELYNISQVGDTMSFIFGKPDVLVTAPKNADTLFIDDNCKIQWTTKSGNSSAKIEISYDNGANYSEIATVNNENSYDWKVSGNESDVCKIRITDDNASGTSPVFSIRHKPFINVSNTFVTEVAVGSDRTVTFQVENEGKGVLHFRAESYAASKNVLINEVYMGGYQTYPANGVELLNRGADIDMTGWKYLWRDNAAKLTQTFNFPDGFKLRSGKTLVLSKMAISPCDSFLLIPTKINWHKPDTLKLAAWVLNSAGIGVDFVKNARATDYDPPAGCSWSGSGVAINKDGVGMARKTTTNNGNANDWNVFDTADWTVNKLNPGQTLTINKNWLLLDNYIGTVNGSSSAKITCNLKTKDMPMGTYTDTLLISHNGANKPSPIKVVFTVQISDSANIAKNTKTIDENSFICTPNPCAKTATRVQGMTFSLTHRDVVSARLGIYDALGNCVRSFVNNSEGKWFWNLRNSNGALVASGAYTAMVTVTTRDGQKKNLTKLIGVKE